MENEFLVDVQMLRITWYINDARVIKTNSNLVIFLHIVETKFMNFEIWTKFLWVNNIFNVNNIKLLFFYYILDLFDGMI